MATSPALRVMAAANDKVTHPTDAGSEARRQRKGQNEEAERRWKWPSRKSKTWKGMGGDVKGRQKIGWQMSMRKKMKTKRKRWKGMGEEQ